MSTPLQPSTAARAKRPGAAGTGPAGLGAAGSRAAAILLSAAVLALPGHADALLEAGQKHYRFRCAACHATSASAPQLFGPHLEGIVGRTAGTIAGYAYSDPDLRGQTFIWDAAYFDEWLQQPQAKYPAMCVPFRGLRSAEEREALFYFLQTL